ncbi:MAG TPA: DUF6600 domain-containing protein [Candidatus Angelobacter sp.]
MKAANLRKLCLPALAIFLLVVVSAPAFADGDDPPSIVGRISYLNGNVSFEPSGENEFAQASLNYPITTGDRIYTDQEGRAEFETGNLAVRIAGNTDLTTTNLSDRLMQFGLAQGTARFRAYSLPEDQSIEIDTPNGAFTVLRSGNYRVETFPDSDTTFVTVTSGELEISGTDDSATIRAGQSVRLTGSNPPEIEYVSAPGSDDFDQWCGDRDRRFDRSRSSQYVSQVPGYEDLDDYGRWEPAQQYGQVWYPSAVPVGWVPYRYGHWAWVEPWGWTWVEDEPWGFAPFHYGRWVFVGSRWGWIPAPPVARRPCYAPALVAFVGGGGFSVSVRVGGGVQAWFPLGPDEPYYPPYHHSDVYLRQVNVTNVRNVTIINNNINVRNTNITYVNQRVAVTAVSTEAFRSSQPVARQVVAVRADEAVRARVIEHPEVHPDVRAVVGGAVQTHPQVQVARPLMIQKTVTRTDTHNGQGNPAVNERGTAPRTFTPPQQGTGQQQTAIDLNKAQHNNTNQQPPKPITPVPPGNGQPQTTFDANKGQHNNEGQPSPRTVTPGPQGTGQQQTAIDLNKAQHNNTNQPPPKPITPVQPGGNEQPHTTFDANKGQHNNGPVNTPTNIRPLVTKTPPPPPPPPFEVRKEAMQSHPGRPLEPQQVQNLQKGQPAGPMHDQEVHPHDSGKATPPDQHGKDQHGKDEKKH